MDDETPPPGRSSAPPEENAPPEPAAGAPPESDGRDQEQPPLFVLLSSRESTPPPDLLSTGETTPTVSDDEVAEPAVTPARCCNAIGSLIVSPPSPASTRPPMPPLLEPENPRPSLGSPRTRPAEPCVCTFPRPRSGGRSDGNWEIALPGVLYRPPYPPSALARVAAQYGVISPLEEIGVGHYGSTLRLQAQLRCDQEPLNRAHQWQRFAEIQDRELTTVNLVRRSATRHIRQIEREALLTLRTAADRIFPSPHQRLPDLELPRSLRPFLEQPGSLDSTATYQDIQNRVLELTEALRDATLELGRFPSGRQRDELLDQITILRAELATMLDARHDTTLDERPRFQPQMFRYSASAARPSTQPPPPVESSPMDVDESAEPLRPPLSQRGRSRSAHPSRRGHSPNRPGRSSRDLRGETGRGRPRTRAAHAPPVAAVPRNSNQPRTTTDEHPAVEMPYADAWDGPPHGLTPAMPRRGDTIPGPPCPELRLDASGNFSVGVRASPHRHLPRGPAPTDSSAPPVRFELQMCPATPPEPRKSSVEMTIATGQSPQIGNLNLEGSPPVPLGANTAAGPLVSPRVGRLSHRGIRRRSIILHTTLDWEGKIVHQTDLVEADDPIRVIACPPLVEDPINPRRGSINPHLLRPRNFPHLFLVQDEQRPPSGMAWRWAYVPSVRHPVTRGWERILVRSSMFRNREDGSSPDQEVTGYPRTPEAVGPIPERGYIPGDPPGACRAGVLVTGPGIPPPAGSRWVWVYFPSQMGYYARWVCIAVSNLPPTTTHSFLRSVPTDSCLECAATSSPSEVQRRRTLMHSMRDLLQSTITGGSSRTIPDPSVPVTSPLRLELGSTTSTTVSWAPQEDQALVEAEPRELDIGSERGEEDIEEPSIEIDPPVSHPEVIDLSSRDSPPPGLDPDTADTVHSSASTLFCSGAGTNATGFPEPAPVVPGRVGQLVESPDRDSRNGERGSGPRGSREPSPPIRAVAGRAGPDDWLGFGSGPRSGCCSTRSVTEGSVRNPLGRPISTGAISPTGHPDTGTARPVPHAAATERHVHGSGRPLSQHFAELQATMPRLRLSRRRLIPFEGIPGEWFDPWYYQEWTSYFEFHGLSLYSDQVQAYVFWNSLGTPARRVLDPIDGETQNLFPCLEETLRYTFLPPDDIQYHWPTLLAAWRLPPTDDSPEDRTAPWDESGSGDSDDDSSCYSEEDLPGSWVMASPPLEIHEADPGVTAAVAWPGGSTDSPDRAREGSRSWEILTLNETVQSGRVVPPAARAAAQDVEMDLASPPSQEGNFEPQC